MKDPPLPVEGEKEDVDKAPLGEPPDRRPTPSPPPLPRSVVSLRKMMFESYSKETDDAKMLVDDVNSRVVSSAKDLVNGTRISLDKTQVKDTKRSSVDDTCTKESEISVDDTKISVRSTLKTGSSPDNTLVDSTLWEDAKISADNILIEDSKISVDKAVVDDDTKISVGTALDSKSQIEKPHLEDSKDSVEETLGEDTKVSEDIALLDDTKVSVEKALGDDNKVSVDNSIMEDTKSDLDNPHLNDTKITVNEAPTTNTKTNSTANESVNSVILEVIARMEDIVKEKEEIAEAVNPVLKTSPPPTGPVATDPDRYPEDLNPFGSDDEKAVDTRRKPSLNPFGSDSEEEDEKPPPRGRPLHQVRGAALSVYSLNPFSSDEDDDPQHPVPMPRYGLLFIL
jgi:hypothetical protein